MRKAPNKQTRVERKEIKPSSAERSEAQQVLRGQKRMLSTWRRKLADGEFSNGQKFLTVFFKTFHGITAYDGFSVFLARLGVGHIL